MAAGSQEPDEAAETEEADQEGRVPSRADLLRELREAKAERVEPPSRAFWESVLYRAEQGLVLEKLRAGYRGFRPTVGGFPPGAGVAAGVRFEDMEVGSLYPDARTPDRLDVVADFLYSLSDYRRFQSEVQLRNIRGSPLGIGLGARVYRYPREDFFGFGLGSREGDRSDYLLESEELVLSSWLEPTPGLRAGGSWALEGPEVRSGTDPDLPSLDEVFDVGEVPGFRRQPGFRRLDAFVVYDWRDSALLPRRGGYYSVRLSAYDDRQLERFDFRRYEVELHQYLPFFQGRRLFALRANAVLTDPADGHDVPFFYQPDLGRNTELRGFSEYRFRDRNRLLLNAEYRWEVWWAADMALFVDAGSVAARGGDLFDVGDMKVDYGVGLRFKTHDAFLLRLDVARSSEGTGVLLRVADVF